MSEEWVQSTKSKKLFSAPDYQSAGTIYQINDLQQVTATSLSLLQPLLIELL